jgi:hypothetical protein
MVQVQSARGAADGGGETGVVATAPRVDYHYKVRPTQVISQRLGAGVGRVLIGTRQKVIDQFAAEIQLQFGKIPLMGKLKPQHVGAEPQGEKVVITDVAAGVEERKHSEDLRVRLYEDGHSIPRPHRAGSCGEQAKKLFALTTLCLRVAQWSSGPSPCPKVAESILDAYRPFGQSMKGIHDALLAPTCGQRRPHKLMRLRSGLQPLHCVGQILVRLLELPSALDVSFV